MGLMQMNSGGESEGAVQTSEMEITKSCLVLLILKLDHIIILQRLKSKHSFSLTFSSSINTSPEQ